MTTATTGQSAAPALSKKENALLSELTQGKTPRLLLSAQTRVDVGHWLSRGRLWLVVAGNEMILFAAGRDAYVERASIDDLRGSIYNHVTGEMVFSPATGMECKRVALEPYPALQLQIVISNKEN